MSNKLIQAYKDAQKEINKTIEFLKNNESVWNKERNLKLDDLFFKYDEIMKKYPHCDAYTNNYFYEFCEDIYRQYDEEWQENAVDGLFNYVGLTSTFYITKIRDYAIKKNGDIMWDYVLINLCGLFSIGDLFDYSIGMSEDGKIIVNTNYCTANIYEDLRYITANLYDNAVNYLHNAVVLADEIDAFKNKQVEYFEEWMTDFEENLEADVIRERNEHALNGAIIKNLFDKYGVTPEDRKIILCSC